MSERAHAPGAQPESTDHMAHALAVSGRPSARRPRTGTHRDPHRGAKAGRSNSVSVVRFEVRISSKLLRRSSANRVITRPAAVAESRVMRILCLFYARRTPPTTSTRRPALLLGPAEAAAARSLLLTEFVDPKEKSPAPGNWPSRQLRFRGSSTLVCSGVVLVLAVAELNLRCLLLGGVVVRRSSR
jgi:hypothetical protein